MQIPLKQSFSLLKVLFHTALIMRILRQLIVALHFLIGVVSEVVLSLLLLLQSRSIIKSGKIVESEVKTIVVMQQVSPKRVYLANHARRCSLGQIFKQLQAF